jgi:hypothetical protein
MNGIFQQMSEAPREALVSTSDLPVLLKEAFDTTPSTASTIVVCGVIFSTSADPMVNDVDAEGNNIMRPPTKEELAEARRILDQLISR